MKARILQLSLFSLVLVAAGLTAYAGMSSPTPASPEGCPVTEANGSKPPRESVDSPQHHGNGMLWTVLPENGTLSIVPDKDGSLTTKFPWWRGVEGRLNISGRRLDGPAEPLRAHIPDGYGDTGFQATGITFPSEGCWEVTGKAGKGELTFVVEVWRAGR